jgi:lipid II:glycine glycyltransferase (peptidoglycan interpeptide bridge formation enzyme)
MLDIRQTPEYAQYLKLLGWETVKINEGQIFFRKFPLIGSVIKVQRVKPPIPFEKIEKIAKERRAFQILIDQELNNDLGLRSKSTGQNWRSFGYKINQTPYFPTKTIKIDLTRNEEEIFNSFSEAKRRAVRRAKKNNLLIKEVKNPDEFIWLKKKSLWEKPVIPIMAKKEILSLYQIFFPKNAKILTASWRGKPVAGIFLLFSGQTAHYWLAAAINQGKKLFAPNLLVFEALIEAKKAGCESFDFEGIYDERFPVKSWLGFTKFKEGFGGQVVSYPPSLIKNRFPLSW